MSPPARQKCILFVYSIKKSPEDFLPSGDLINLGYSVSACFMLYFDEADLQADGADDDAAD